MSEQYSVEAILSVVDQGFTQAMERAERQTDALTKGGKSSSQSVLGMAKSFGIGQIAANVATSTFNMVGDAVGAITSEMNDSKKAWATFDGNMRMIGKSDAEIVKVQASLQDFATATIYNASDMASTYSQMAAIGVADTERVVKGLGGLAAASENPAQAMKSLSTQMVQAMAQPQIKWQDFVIMLDHAPAAMAQVAQEMGYSLDDFIAAIQDGEIASKDFAAAVAEVGTNEHFSAMATEFKTTDQALEGLVETLSNKFMPMYDLLDQVGIKLVEGVTDWIDGVDIEPVIGYMESVAEWFGVATDEIDSLAESASMSAEEIQAVADGWGSMTLDEKQAQIETMGQEDLETLMNLLGVDFENIPDEYTKNAYLNAHGADALEEILWVTGQWHNLTFEEKRAVLEAQLENDELKEAIELGGLWDNTEFYSKLAEINMNDNDAEQQVLDLINHYRELDGQEPIEIEVDTENVVEGGEDLKDFSDSVDSANKGTKGFVKEFVESGARLERSTVNLKRGFDNAFESFQNGDYESGIFNLGNSVATFFQDGINNAGFTLAGIFDTINANYSYEDWQEIGKGIGDLISGGLKLFFENDFEFDFSGIQTDLNSLDLLMEEALNGLFDGLLESIGIEGEIADVENFLSGITFEGDLSAWAESIKLAFQESFADWDWDILLPEFAYTDLNGNRWELDWNAAIERMVSGFGDNPIDDTIVMFNLVPEYNVDFNTDFREEFANIFINEDMYTEQDIEVITNYVIDEEGNLSAELVALMESQGIDPQNVTIPTIVDFILEHWEELGLYEVVQQVLEGESVEAEVDAEVTPEVEVIEPDSDWRKYFEDNPMGEIQGSADLKIIPTSAVLGMNNFNDVQVPQGIDLSATTDQTVEVMASDGSVQVMSMSIDENGLPILEPIDMTNELAITGTADTSGVSIGDIDTSGLQALQQSYTAMTSHIQQSMNLAANYTRFGGSMMNMALQSSGFQITATAQSISNQVLTPFSGLQARMFSAGTYAGAGFNQGLASQRSQIIGTAQSIASAVADTINTALQMASPSRLLFQSGSWAIEGLGLGMESMLSYVEGIANDVAYATIPDLAVAEMSLVPSRVPGWSNVNESRGPDNNIESKLDEVISAIRDGQVINVDGRQVSKLTSKYDNRNLGKSLEREAYTR